ncbi:nitric oxide reductase activation protein NorD [Pseudothioclava nitratireducens]|uniref:nitric oxide reductase activation protein NorD n=1 Tax=Pseudothioclava nitratireducens TaxID=1928646 RepID=UPI0023DB5566|nr:VWA domain-containing protein [Defluviimonas nitratireducens]MDF1620628.1 VWA domain-containing protein [Defluviimonas nitratireducens]
MKVALDDYAPELIKAAPELEDSLEGLFHEAARLMSPAGLKDYMDGARAMNALGKGPRLLTAYLDEMPQVVKECGEDVIRDVVGAVMKLTSMVSGEVITLMISTMPGAAQRFGDPDLLRGYLALVHRLAANAPRGLRPMFGVLEELLSKLTLSGLRRWVDFGAEAYRRDLPKQADYFGLVSEDSRAVLKQERRGTLFIDSQRRLNFYLRAFWGRDFFLRPSAADFNGFRPFIEDGALHLPDAVDAIGSVSGLDLYRAMCAHMAAHIVYSDRGLGQEALNPAQIFLIGLIEDARVEHCAIRAFPGLATMFRALMPESPPKTYEHESMYLLEKLAIALIEPGRRTGDLEIDNLVETFHGEVENNLRETMFSWSLGIELYNLLAQRRAVPSLRVLETLRIPYRDDNRFVWALDGYDWDNVAYLPAQGQVRRHVGLMEFINEVDVETAGDDAQEVWVLSSELFPYEDEGVSFNESEGKTPISDPFHYGEWDYKVQLARPSWATVYEHCPPQGDPETIDTILNAHRGIRHRIKQIVDRLRPQGVSRQRRLEDGDELDLNAAVEAAVMQRIGMQPDMRITMRNVINRRDLAVLILLDLSESTNETVRGSDKTVLDLTREASALVASAIEGIGDPFAIHGFASDGRHDVQYSRFKNFEQKFGDEAKARLAGMTGGLSTRMGAAMRHASHHLLQRPEAHKLLLIVTDGEPADIDERDPQYLRMDAKKAVAELLQIGIHSYCLTLDPEADRYVSRIFGANNYTIIDQVERLPEKLPTLFAQLTK